MASWLHLKDASKLVDDKLRAKLNAHFAAVDTQRRDKKLSKIKGIVRQLYQDGNISDGDKLLEKTLLTSASYATPAVHDSDSDDSSAS